MADSTDVRTAPDLEAEIQGYFSSIEDSFESTLAMGPQRGLVDTLIPVFIAGFVLSVVPISPLLLWALFHWYLIPRGLVRGGVPFPFDSFFAWWIVLAVWDGLLLWLLLSISSKREKKREQQSLAPAVMRFALCYAIVQEIDRYRTNRILKHADQAREFWFRFVRLLRQFLNPRDPFSTLAVHRGTEIDVIMASEIDAEASAEIQAHGFGVGPGLSKFLSVFPQIDLLRVSLPWFKLEPSTVKIADAFNALQLKITGRLKDRKDLPQVANVLKNLAQYLYSIIPELSSTEAGNETVQVLGERALMRFAEEVEKLPVYRPEARPLAAKEKASRKFVSALNWLFGLFSHDVLLVRFFAWWVLVQAITLLALRTALQYIPTLKTDSTLIALVVGTPLLVAAAALAGTIRRKQ